MLSGTVEVGREVVVGRVGCLPIGTGAMTTEVATIE